MSTGKFIRYLGWAIVVWVAIRYTYGFIDIYSDASVRAFAPLLLIEGGFYLIVGLAVLFIGKRIERKEAAKRE